MLCIQFKYIFIVSDMLNKTCHINYLTKMCDCYAAIAIEPAAKLSLHILQDTCTYTCQWSTVSCSEPLVYNLHI